MSSAAGLSNKYGVPQPTGVTAGTYGSATVIPVVTIDNMSLITGISSVSVAGAPPGGPAGGDLTGTYPNPTLANTAVVAGPYGSATQSPSFTVDAKGRLTAAANVAIAGVAPGGAAGGDLTGTYPNPTLANTAVVAGSYTTTNLTVDAAGRITAAANGATSFPPNGSAGGDLSGTYPNPTVAKLNGQPMSANVPVNGANIAWNGSTYLPIDVSPYYGTNTATNSGTTSLTLGNGASTLAATNACAVGTSATATGLRGTAVGHLSSATGTDSVAYGANATASNTACVSLGKGATSGTTNTAGVAIGNNAAAVNLNAIAIGQGATTSSGTNNVAIGNTATASAGTNGIAIGNAATAGTSNTTIAIGASSSATATSCIAIGVSASATTLNCISIGNTAVSSTGSGCVVIGQGSSSGAGGAAVAIAQQATATGSASIALGNLASATATDAVALGANTTCSATGVAVGKSAACSVASGTCVGRSSVANAAGTAVGNGATTNAITNAVSLGVSASPNDANHALALVLPAGSVSAQTLGATLNTASNKVMIYGSLYATTGGAGPTTLTVTSAAIQVFTTSQTVTLPVATTLELGWHRKIINRSAGNVTVQSSGANTVITLATMTACDVVCILASGTGTASWSALGPVTAT